MSPPKNRPIKVLEYKSSQSFSLLWFGGKVANAIYKANFSKFFSSGTDAFLDGDRLGDNRNDKVQRNLLQGLGIRQKFYFEQIAGRYHLIFDR